MEQLFSHCRTFKTHIDQTKFLPNKSIHNTFYQMPIWKYFLNTIWCQRIHLLRLNILGFTKSHVSQVGTPFFFGVGDGGNYWTVKGTGEAVTGCKWWRFSLKSWQAVYWVLPILIQRWLLAIWTLWTYIDQLCQHVCKRRDIIIEHWIGCG